MARPTEYAQPRVDTKVRLRADHAARLKEAQAERGLGRNRLIEMALDDFFYGKGKAPRLAKVSKSATPGKTQAKTTTRHQPRVPQIGKQIEEAAAARADGVTPNFKETPGKARVTPRSRRLAR